MEIIDSKVIKQRLFAEQLEFKVNTCEHQLMMARKEKFNDHKINRWIGMISILRFEAKKHRTITTLLESRLSLQTLTNETAKLYDDMQAKKAVLESIQNTVEVKKKMLTNIKVTSDSQSNLNFVENVSSNLKESADYLTSLQKSLQTLKLCERQYKSANARYHENIQKLIRLNSTIKSLEEQVKKNSTLTPMDIMDQFV